jgi:hypothetical protein
MILEFHKGQYLEIFTNGKPRADQPADAIGYQHFRLIVDDIDARLEHLAAMNVYPQRPAREGRWDTASRFSAIPTTTSSS